MKKYRLKQWYPSLAIGWRLTDNYEYDETHGIMHNRTRRRTVKISMTHLHPDFWELVKEPLFVTEDGVEVFDRDTIVYNVRNNASAKIGVSVAFLSKYDFEHKVFFHESNADEYIWRNKKVFSYEDFIRWGNVPYERVIMQLAKKRSKQ